MPYLVFRRQLTIEWGHCDPAGIVFNSRYFEYFDWNTALLFQAALGLSKPELQARFDADMPLVDARAKFMRPTTYGDVVEVASTIGEFRRSSFDVRHTLTKDGEPAVEGVETRVWVGRDPNDPSQFRAKPLPAELIDRFRAG
jgi:4-hydroxybenzoyl-CoA thioesterase